MKQLSIHFRVGFDLIIKSEEEITDKSLLSIIKKNPKKENEYRAAPYRYKEIIKILEKNKIALTTDILVDPILSLDYINRMNIKLNLRPYQELAIGEFLKNKGTGVVVLPTAAGKTIIGLKMIERLKQKTLIVVPTKNLLHQCARKWNSLIL